MSFGYFFAFVIAYYVFVYLLLSFILNKLFIFITRKNKPVSDDVLDWLADLGGSLILIIIILVHDLTIIFHGISANTYYPFAVIIVIRFFGYLFYENPEDKKSDNLPVSHHIPEEEDLTVHK